MDLNLTEQQKMLQETIRELRERDYPKDTLVAIDAGRADPAGPWSKLVSTGILGSLIPEAYGGAGASLADTATVYEELGRGPIPGPHFSSGILGALAVLEAGSDEQKSELLPAIATGERVITLAVTEPDYGWGPEFVRMVAQRRGEWLVLNGTKLYVHDAADATDMIVAVRVETGGIRLLLLGVEEPGVACRPIAGFATGLSEVSLAGVNVRDTALLGGIGGEDGWAVLSRVFQRALPVLCAYQVGGLAQVFDMSLSYSQTRHQFQQPIGRFQRVQDHVIDLVNHLDSARWTTYEALWKLDTGRPAAAGVHMAAAVASEAYYLGCNSAHDVHAGIGIMREYGLTLHTKMSRTLYHYLGGPRYHRKRLAEALEL
jgi:alkylation response protein AidB-like acyl-CoA dehydrogenase